MADGMEDGMSLPLAIRHQPSAISHQPLRRAPVMRRLVCLALGVGVLSATAVAVQAPPPVKSSTRAATLTAMDYIEIQQLVVRYAWANDTCGNNGNDYADLYVADGWFGSSRNGK